MMRIATTVGWSRPRQLLRRCWERTHESRSILLKQNPLLRYESSLFTGVPTTVRTRTSSPSSLRRPPPPLVIGHELDDRRLTFFSSLTSSSFPFDNLVLTSRSLARNALPLAASFSSSSSSTAATSCTPSLVRLSRIVASGSAVSRRVAERLVADGLVTVNGATAHLPQALIDVDDDDVVVRVRGSRLDLDRVRRRLDVSSSDGSRRPRVWLVHKLAGEIVTERDPRDRPSVLARVASSLAAAARRRRRRRGRSRDVPPPPHLKPVGRLDVPTEGLLVLTDDGGYAREMELPRNELRRTYRARVFGTVTPAKLEALRRDRTHGDEGLLATLDRTTTTTRGRRRGRSITPPANTWLRVTCVEGKNRMIRKTMERFGLKVTRLIRTSYGDYDLDTIPPGMALEVPWKPVETQKRRGPLLDERRRRPQRRRETTAANDEDPRAPPIEWISRPSL